MLLSHSGERARAEEEKEGGCTEKTKGQKNMLLSSGNLCVLCCGLVYFFFSQNKTSQIALC